MRYKELIKKIISGGQTGVDRAALDFALSSDIACGGWCPKGRKAEDGIISGKYPLKETNSTEYKERTELNVRSADGTLILYLSGADAGTLYTMDIAKMLNSPCMVINIFNQPDYKKIRDWIQTNNINTLNIAGPRESKNPGVYKNSLNFLRTLFGA